MYCLVDSGFWDLVCKSSKLGKGIIQTEMLNAEIWDCEMMRKWQPLLWSIYLCLFLNRFGALAVAGLLLQKVGIYTKRQGNWVLMLRAELASWRAAPPADNRDHLGPTSVLAFSYWKLFHVWFMVWFILIWCLDPILIRLDPSALFSFFFL